MGALRRVVGPFMGPVDSSLGMALPSRQPGCVSANLNIKRSFKMRDK